MGRPKGKKNYQHITSESRFKIEKSGDNKVSITMPDAYWMAYLKSLEESEAQNKKIIHAIQKALMPNEQTDAQQK